MFANANHSFFPNPFVNVPLLVEKNHNLPTVPAAAIQRGPQGTYIYAVAKDSATKDATAKIFPVTIAQTTGNSVGLSAGLNPGDVVVIDGQDKLQDGTKVNPSPAAGSNGAGRGPASPSPAQGAPKSGSPSKGQAGGSPR